MPELHPYDVIRRPLITEGTHLMAAEANQYTFEVALHANKTQIREAIELVFDIPDTVLRVNTMVMPAKRGRRGRKYFIRSKAWKKAIVTLAPETKLEIFNV